MNQVFIAGIVADRPRLTQPENGAVHLKFALSVRHRTAKGVVKQEVYAVNAWNKAALWGAKQLAQGQLVALQGYLTQHTGEDGVLSVEVTAEEFLPARKSGGQDWEQEQVSPPAAIGRSDSGRGSQRMGIIFQAAEHPEPSDSQDRSEAASAIEAAS